MFIQSYEPNDCEELDIQRIRPSCKELCYKTDSVTGVYVTDFKFDLFSWSWMLFVAIVLEAQVFCIHM